MKVFRSITSFLLPAKQDLLVHDPTLYQVDTVVGKYEGKIVYQDDVVIKLRVNDDRLVKILKSNINKIRIISQEPV